MTLCTDTPKQLREGKDKHGARAVMLSDRDLAVARRFGVENRNTSLRPPGLVGLPIPTTLLADADGIVRWIDQSADYMERSEPGRVMDALANALPRAAA